MKISDIKLGKLYHFPEYDIDLQQYPKEIKIKASQPFVVLEKIYKRYLYRLKVLTSDGDVGWLILGKFSLNQIKPLMNQ